METRPGTDRGAAYDASTSAPPPEKASVVEDFIDIFYAPAKVFARRGMSGFGMPMLIILVLSAGFAFASQSVFSQIFDAEFSRGMARAMQTNPRLTPEIANSMKPMQEKIAGAFVYAGPLLVVFFTAIFVWIAAKIFSASVTFGQVMTIGTLAYIPRLLGSLIGVLQVVLMDTTNFTNRFSLAVTPARFMDPDTANPKLFALAGNVELFAIWSAILIAIGVSVVSKKPRSTGYLVSGAAFVVMSGLAVLLAR